MPAIEIRLVGEKDDRLFEGIEMDNTIQYIDLKTKIQSLTSIPTNFQQLQYRGEELPLVDHPIKDIKLGEQIVVKHAFLDKWSGYLELCKRVNDPESIRPERILFATQAAAFSKPLENSGFFNVYTTFGAQWRESISSITRYVDTTNDDLEKSATKFFSKMCPDAKIDFKPKQGGSRAGIVVVITCNNEETNYFMKTYHHAGSYSYLQKIIKQHLPDLREICAYRILQILGVGPVAFFPFSASSKHIHYIATEGVKEFKELGKLEDLNLQNKIVVESYLLSLILGIRDLHEENIGSTKEKALCIIDFYVPDANNFIRRNILDDLKNKNNISDGIERAHEILNEIGPEERMKIAKDALPRWSQIKNITSDIIGVEKTELKKIGIEESRTHDFESYLEDIKENYDSICSALN